jgi:excisionase family DNA binding protein
MNLKTNDVLTTKQVAFHFRLHPLTVRKLCQKGELPGFKVGRLWRFSKIALDKWVEEQTFGPAN